MKNPIGKKQNIKPGMETQIGRNFNICSNVKYCIKQAKSLGVYDELKDVPLVTHTQVVLADEIVDIKEGKSKDLYAFIHREHMNNTEDNGYFYYRIHDLFNNPELLARLLSEFDNLNIKVDKIKLLRYRRIY